MKRFKIVSIKTDAKEKGDEEITMDVLMSNY